MSFTAALPRLPVVHSTVLAIAMAFAGGVHAQDHSRHVPPQETVEEGAAIDHAAMRHDPVDETEDEPAELDHSQMIHVESDTPPEPLIPVPQITAADRAAAFPELDHAMQHGDGINHYVLFDRLEARDGEHGAGQAWEVDAWIGGDINRLWLRSEGERASGRTRSADLEVLYGRSISPWWDLLAGVRHEFRPEASQSFAAIGVQGLTPYKFEIQATAYIGRSGQTAARVEIEYDTLLTNRLILQWLAEVDFFGRDDARRGMGSGLSTLKAGLRMRYEITRQFAPYIGLTAERAYNGTADARRDHGEAVDDASVVVGVRVWF